MGSWANIAWPAVRFFEAMVLWLFAQASVTGRNRRALERLLVGRAHLDHLARAHGKDNCIGSTAVRTADVRRGIRPRPILHALSAAVHCRARPVPTRAARKAQFEDDLTHRSSPGE